MRHSRLLPQHTTLLSLSLALFVGAAYLCFYSGVFHSSDTAFILSATESIVKRGEFSSDQMWWHQSAIETVAPDGEAYSMAGIGASLLAIPLYWVALWRPEIGLVQTALLTNLVVTVVNVVLVFKWVRALGYRTRVALTTASLFALGTSALVYANDYFSEPQSALALTATLFALYLYRVQKQVHYLLLAGLSIGLALSVKPINGLFLLPAILYVLDSFRKNIVERPSQRATLLRRTLKATLIFAAPVLCVLALLGWYNAVRFGNPLTSGYPEWVRFDHPLLEGIWDLLFSSEKSLFVYNPILIASAFAFPLFWQRHRAEAITILGISTLHLGTYTTWHAWQGGLAWGPRFLMPLLPLLSLPLAPLLRLLLSSHQPSTIKLWLMCLGLLALALLSVGVQALGASVSFIRYENSYGKLNDGSLASQWPVLGHALLFQPANWEMAWLTRRGGNVAVDGLSFGLILLLLALTTFGLLIAYRQRRSAGARWVWGYQILVAIITVAVVCVLLVRARDDVRYHGGEDYAAALQRLATVSEADDVVLLDNHLYTNFFLNSNRARARWYALDHDHESAERTWQLLERSAGRYARIWLVTDRSPATPQPRPLEAWLSARAYKLDEVAFSPYARLLAYDTQMNPSSAKQVLNAQLGDAIVLSAFDLSTSIGADSPLKLTLYWQASSQVTQDFTVFVQAFDASDRLIWQADRYPVDGFRPTRSWLVGETITDRYVWRVSGDMPPGTYQLIAGMYDWRTGERLPVSDGTGAPRGDYVGLGRVTIPNR